MPEWDIQSYFPPGRPVDYYLGWSYTMAGIYKIFEGVLNMEFMRFSGLFVAVFAALSAIPAYFVGRHVTNRWGGLFTAFFAIATPTFLAVSMAGYPDSDATDVFYSFLAIAATLFAIHKAKMVSFANFPEFRRTLVRYLPYVIPALIAYWLFAFNWSSSWYIYFMFVLFVPLLVVARVLESLVSRQGRPGLSLIVSKIRENKGTILAILLIGFLGEAVTLVTSGFPFNTIPPHDQLVQGLNLLGAGGAGVAVFVAFMLMYGGMVGVAFGRKRGVMVGAVAGGLIAAGLALMGITGLSLIVNISVAELQPLNVFSADGFNQIVSRIGILPIILAFASFVVTGLKIFYRKEIHLAEYFAIMWLLLSFFLITQGIRFALLFSMATATAAGFTIGNLVTYTRSKNIVMFASVAAVLIFSAWLVHLQSNIEFVQAATGGLEVSDNWRSALDWLKDNADENSLVATWWDPGHIIAAYTGLKVHADGAHCGTFSCKPYDHNVRIQDMGRFFSTSDPNEALTIMSKYMNTDSTACDAARESFGDKVPQEACEPVSEMYIIASQDLIGKYFWLSYFGSGEGQNYAQVTFSGRDQQGNLVYGCRTNVVDGICSDGLMTLTSLDDGRVVVVISVPEQGIRNALVGEVIVYNNGVEERYDFTNSTNAINGLAWVDPGFGGIIFMNPSVKDSVFTDLFFFEGRGLEQYFEQVYSNSEVKIYRVKF
jgi:dolichyl-diphosphooligosaccharide--protein glycosyltransferase